MTTSVNLNSEYLIYHTEPMSKILDRLYLGTLYNAKNLGLGHTISMVVNCTQYQVKLSKPVDEVVLGWEDGNPVNYASFWLGVKTISGALHEGRNVLVCCHAGISRSASLVMAHLYLAGWDWDKAYEFVKLQRDIIHPHPEIVRSIKQHLKIWPYGYLDKV
jgi:protein-tyrosine phosphatase